MFCPTSGSFREPSSSVGSPKSAGFGGRRVGEVVRDRPFVADQRNELCHRRSEAIALVCLVDVQARGQHLLAVGAESGQTLARRAGEAVAERLGTTAAIFPGDHGGFLGGEYGQTGEPDAFATTLREVLAAKV